MNEETTMREVLEELNLPEYYNIVIKNINEQTLINSSYVGTGTKISILSKNDTLIESYTIVVKGDITGDGLVNFKDIVTLVKYVYEPELNFEWNEAVKIAAKVSETIGMPQVEDIMRLISYYYGGIEW